MNTYYIKSVFSRIFQKMSIIIYLSFFIGIAPTISAQTPFWSDSFESIGSPSSGTRTPSTNFSCNTPNSSYFKIATNADLSLVMTNGQTNYSNIDGTQFWAGEDLDAGSACTNNSQSSVQTITWTSINISGRTNIQFKGLFGAHNPFPTGSVWDNLPSNVPPSIDYLWVEYRIDGGAWTKIISFNVDVANNSGSLLQDTNGDDLGDGLKLSKVFQEVIANITGTGTTLELRFTASANGLVTEEFAIDNFRLVENLPSSVISSTGTLSALNTTYGTASSNTSFNVSGTSMTAGITVTAPTGFEVSLSAGSGFASNIVVGSAGNIPSTTVYVRLAATTIPGNYSGNVVLSSTGASNVNVATVLSTVNPKPLTVTGVTVNNKIYDGNTSATLAGTPTLSGGLIGSDVVSLNIIGASGTFINKNVGNNKSVTIAGYSLTGAQASYYTLSQPTGLIANITEKGLTISGLTANNKIYDGTTTATLSGSPNLIGVIIGDVVSLSGTPIATFASPNAGTAIAVTVTGYSLTGTNSGNYTLSPPTGLTANITALLSPSAGALPNGTVGLSYNQMISQTGIVSTVSWSVSSGSLPSGLSLNNSTGEISGIPTATGTFNFTIQASGGVCCVGTQSYSILISCPTIVFNNTIASNAIVGTTYTLDASVTGNTQAVTYSVSPTLPAGLSLNTSTGQISGTPTSSVSSTTYTITASQSTGVCTTTQNYTFAVVCPTASLNPATLPNGTIGTAYSQTVTQTGLPSGTINWSVSAGTIPTGLSLNTSTGVISGTPSATGTFNFTIQASNSGCLASRTYSIVVSCPTITFVNTTASGATVGNPYNLDASVSGNTQTITYSVSPALPVGLSLNTSTGQISGTPTAQTVSTTYTITASQSSGVCTATQNYTFAVTCPFTFTPSTLPNGTVGTAYNQTITQTGLTGTVIWSVSIGSLPTGLSLNSSTGAITGTPSSTGTFNFTIQATDGACTVTLGYSIVVNCPTITFTNTTASNGIVGSTYSLNAGVTGNTATITYSVSPTLPAGLSLNTSTGQISGTPTAVVASTTYTITASQSAGVCGITQIYTFAVSCPTIAINPSSLSAGTIGTTYNQTITQTGLPGTASWSVSVGTLPTGLSLNNSTGEITGTPSATGAFNFTIQVTDGTCSQTQAYSVVVSCPTLIFNNTSVSNGIIGSSYNLDVSISGNTQAVTYSVSPALPAGLSLNTSTGQITGTPSILTSSNTYTVTASQSTGVCSVTQNYTFAVACPTASLNPNTLPNATIGIVYNQTITQTGLPSGTINWSVSTGTLPTGLSLNTSTGVISGTPSAIGIFNFTIEANNSGCLASRAYSIVVSCPTILFTNTTVNDAIIGISYNLDASVTGNTQAVIYSVTPALPTGLSLNTSTGVISGTPSALTPSTTYTITASQSAGVCSVTQNYTFAVNCAGITINPNVLSNARQFVGYSQALSQTGLSGTITWSVSAGILPTGLSLNSTSGIISGTPNTIQTANFTIQATNGTCNFTKSYTIVVAPSGAIIELSGSLDFGEVLVFQSAKKSIQIKNVGVEPLIINQIFLPPNVFVSSPLEKTNLNPNETASLEIIFTPNAVQTYSGQLLVQSNAVAGNNITNIIGKGTNPTALNVSKEIVLKTYPNPTENILTVKVSQIDIYHVKVYTILGIEMKKFNVSNTAEDMKIDLSELPSGVYLIELNNSKKQKSTIRVVKQ